MSVSIQPSLLFEGKGANLTCSLTVVNADVDTPINFTTSWSGPSGLLQTNTSHYDINTTRTSMLQLSELSLERDNGSSYSCAVQLFSIADPAHILSSNSSDQLLISIDSELYHLLYPRTYCVYKYCLFFFSSKNCTIGSCTGLPFK